MKIVYIIARLLLGLVFLVFGSNLFLHFIPMGPAPTGPALQFFTALMVTHYIHFVAAIQVAGGLLLLINRYVPLGLVLLAPVIVNIDLVHILMAPSGLPMAGFVTVLWLLVAYQHRTAFAALLERHHAQA